MLTIDTIPLFGVRSLEFGMRSDWFPFRTPHSAVRTYLFVFPVQAVAAAAAAELVELKPVRRVLLVLRRDVVTLFALGALQNYVISRHKSSSAMSD